MIEHVQTKKEIEAVLAERGLRPRKRFGQHFLIDGNLMRRLAESAEVSESDLVLEVGPGTGGLTDLLARRAGSVVCAEIDRDMCDILRGRFGWDERVTIVEGDVLRSKHQLSAPIDELLRKTGVNPSRDRKGAVEQSDQATLDTVRQGRVARRSDGASEELRITNFELPSDQSRAPQVSKPSLSGAVIKLVSNLPYQIATPLVMNLLVDYPRVRRLCFTVQAEVGERIVAKPGGKDYGPLAIVSQSVCEIRQVARIGPQAFWPQPAVDSVMLRMDVCKEPFAGEMPVGRDREIEGSRDRGRDGGTEGRRDEAAAAMSAFAAFVRGFFDHRRKQLRAAAGYVLSREQIGRLAQSHDMQRRPEEVPVEEWMEMYEGSRN